MQWNHDLMAKTPWISVVFSVNFQARWWRHPWSSAFSHFFRSDSKGWKGRMDQPLSHFNRTKHCLKWLNMGLSENVVYYPKPNGFHDQTIQFLNGYFIGNIREYTLFSDKPTWLNMTTEQKTPLKHVDSERMETMTRLWRDDEMTRLRMSSFHVALQDSRFGICETISQALNQPNMVNTFADENRLAFSGFLEMTLRSSAKMTVHSVENVALVNAFHIEDALHSVHFLRIPLPGIVTPTSKEKKRGENATSDVAHLRIYAPCQSQHLAKTEIHPAWCQKLKLWLRTTAEIRQTLQNYHILSLRRMESKAMKTMKTVIKKDKNHKISIKTIKTMSKVQDLSKEVIEFLLTQCTMKFHP